LLFPYFGVSARIKRRIKRDKVNKNKQESTHKLESVVDVLSKDKAFARDLKLKQLDIE
jgi:predicted GIY-YIG superfamily endonuclease